MPVAAGSAQNTSGFFAQNESTDQGEGFEKFFDDFDDTQDDPYKSLGPHHAEIPVPLRSDDPFESPWHDEVYNRYYSENKAEKANESHSENGDGSGLEMAGQERTIPPLEILKAQQNISDYVNGTKSFEQVTNDYAVLYAEKVLSNKKWNWDEINSGIHLTYNQKKAIRNKTFDQNLLTIVPMKPGTNYPDFLKAGLIYEINGNPVILSLPENLWQNRDRIQFAWLDKALLAQTGQSRPVGQVWHHSEIPGQMELVPFGIHNIIYHKGGRSPGGWAYGVR